MAYLHDKWEFLCKKGGGDKREKAKRRKTYLMVFTDFVPK